MSSSFQDFKIKAFRKSKDAESTTTIQEQETPTPPEKTKIGAKAKKLAGRLVPAALGKLRHPDCCYFHKVIWLVLGAVMGCLGCCMCTIMLLQYNGAAMHNCIVVRYKLHFAACLLAVI